MNGLRMCSAGRSLVWHARGPIPCIKSGIVAYACNLNTPEDQTGGSGIQDQPWLHSKFKASLGFVRFCPKKEGERGGDEEEVRKRERRRRRRKRRSRTRTEAITKCLSLERHSNSFRCYQSFFFFLQIKL